MPEFIDVYSTKRATQSVQLLRSNHQRFVRLCNHYLKARKHTSSEIWQDATLAYLQDFSRVRMQLEKGLDHADLEGVNTYHLIYFPMANQQGCVFVGCRKEWLLLQSQIAAQHDHSCQLVWLPQTVIRCCTTLCRHLCKWMTLASPESTSLYCKTALHPGSAGLTCLNRF